MIFLHFFFKELTENLCTIGLYYESYKEINKKLKIVMWMQQGRICILGKIEFSTDYANAGKNVQVKLYFISELKVILYLWKK